MNEHEVWTSEPATVDGSYWLLGYECDVIYLAVGQPIPEGSERSSAPIPPAEEIAAMREVCATAKARWESLVYAAENGNRGDTLGTLEAVKTALSKLDAARKGGATC